MLKANIRSCRSYTEYEISDGCGKPIGVIKIYQGGDISFASANEVDNIQAAFYVSHALQQIFHMEDSIEDDLK